MDVKIPSVKVTNVALLLDRWTNSEETTVVVLLDRPAVALNISTALRGTRVEEYEYKEGSHPCERRISSLYLNNLT